MMKSLEEAKNPAPGGGKAQNPKDGKKASSDPTLEQKRSFNAYGQNICWAIPKEAKDERIALLLTNINAHSVVEYTQCSASTKMQCVRFDFMVKAGAYDDRATFIPAGETRTALETQHEAAKNDIERMVVLRKFITKRFKLETKGTGALS